MADNSFPYAARKDIQQVTLDLLDEIYTEVCLPGPVDKDRIEQKLKLAGAYTNLLKAMT